MGLRFEAWSLPWSGSFDRVIADIPVIDASGLVRFNDFGEASITVPDDYARLSDIISTTVGRLIRVYNGSTIIQEFLAERVDRDITGEVATISGGDLSTAFDRAVVYPYDYPTNEFLDHIWAGKNVLANPGFEENSIIPNIWELWNDASSGNFTISDGTDTTSNIAFNASPSSIETRLQDDITAITDVLVTGAGSEADPWRIEFVDPGLGLTLTVDDSGLTGGTSTLTETQAGENVPVSWTRSQQISFGTPRVFGTYASDGFRLTEGSEPVRTGTYALRVNGITQFAGHQQVVNVKPGGIYQAKQPIWTSSTTDLFRLVVRTINGNLIQTTAEATTGSASAWDTTTWVINDLQIPDDVSQIIFRFAYVGTGNPTPYYADDAELVEGDAAANVGTIVTSLMDDATTDHSGDTRGTILDWVDYTGFDTSLDSAGASWDDLLSFTAFRGMTYGQVFDKLRDLGYEWTLTPKASPGATTHDLNWYNEGNSGTDYSSSATPAINVGQSTTSGPVIQRIPDYTAVLVEGADGQFREDSDGTAETNFGRFEKYSGDLALNSTVSLTAAGDHLLAEESENRTAVKVSVVENSAHPIPLVDYTVGDNINFQIPPVLSKTARRIQTISWRHGEPASYDVTGSYVFEGEAGGWEALRKLLRKFDPLREDAEEAATNALFGRGGSNIPTVFIAASDSKDSSRATADYVCDGTNDEIQFELASDDLPLTGGRILVAEGTYTFATRTSFPASTIVEVIGLGMPTFTCTDGLFAFDVGGRVSGLSVTGGTGGSSSMVLFNNDTVADQVYLVDNCNFDTITAKTVIQPRDSSADPGLTVIRNNNFSNITISGGGGASPNGVIWDDEGSAPTREWVIDGNRFDNVSGAIVDSNGLQRIHATNNILTSSTGKREGKWSHNWINGTYEAGDHDNLSVAGSDSTAIHDNVAAEISAITEKDPPVPADLVIIEDSAASDAKKKLQIGNIADALAHADFASFGTDDHTEYGLADGTRQFTYVDISGLTGATSASRYVGATTSGAPASGTFAVGDYVIAQDGNLYVCTVAGSPGTWTAVGGGLSSHDHTGGGDGGVLTADEHDSYSEYDEIAAPGTPATGKVRFYAKSDGKVYIKDDAGTETDLTSGGGGGTTWKDTAASSEGPLATDDDEFDDDSLSGWTAVTVSGTATWTEGQDVLSVVYEDQTSGDVAAQLKSINGTPTAPIEIITAVRGLSSGNFNTAGLVFTDGTASSSNALWVRYSFSDRSFAVTSGTLTDIQNSVLSSATLQQQPASWVYIKARWDSSNTWQGFASPDGVSWTDLGFGTDSFTMTPTHYGVAVASFGTGNEKISTFEFFRSDA